MQKSEWDFAVKWEGLPENQQRFLLEYEYARSSPEARKGVQTIREGGRKPLGPGAYVMLAKCTAFPDKPFLSISAKERQKLILKGFGDLDLLCQKFPSDKFYNHQRDDLEQVPLKELEEGLRQSIRANSNAARVQKHYLLKINWRKYSDAELAEAFHRWLIDHRPNEIPKPSLLGRNPGNARYRNIKDRLNGLAAYRFDEAGLSRENARAMGFTEYTSDLGWANACQNAASRLQSMFPHKGRVL